MALLKILNRASKEFSEISPNTSSDDTSSGRGLPGNNTCTVEDLLFGAPSTSANDAINNPEQLCFHSVHSNAIEISPNRSTARLAAASSTCGATFSDRPIRVNEKVCLRFVDINMGCLDPCISIGFTSKDPAIQGKLTSNILHPMNTGYWIQWIRHQHYKKDKLLYFYVNKKGEIRYGINGEELDMIKPKVNTAGPLWAVIQLFGSLRKVQFADSVMLEGVENSDRSQVENVGGCHNQSQIEHERRRHNQSQVEHGGRRHNQSQVQHEGRRHNQSQVEHGGRRHNQSQVEHGSRRHNQSQVDDRLKSYKQSQVEDRVRSYNQSRVTSNPKNLPPLRFHGVHSNAIKISPDRSTARLAAASSSCGATFSDRPVRVNEKIRIRFVHFDNWVSLNPRISIGFTSNDPATISQSMLNYDLNPRNTGYWIEWIRHQYYEKNKLLYYYVNERGEIRYGINGEELGVITPKVKTSGPLWAAIQLFGRLREVQLADPEMLEEARHPNHSQIDDDLQVNRIRSFPVNEPLPPSRYQNRLVPLSFHATKGRNIQFYNDSGVAARLDGGLRQGYIFSAQPMRLGQTIVIQVLATEDISRGTVALGVTACDPTTLTPEELPDNAEYLLDRPEYWVVHPDAANGLRTGDELGVTLTPYGKLEVTKNNSSDTVTVLHVDHKINLWAFVDVSGPIRRVKLLISEEVVEPSLESFKKEEKAVLPSTSRGTLSECTICLENQVGSVIYKCGHMCMCYNCAVKQWKGVGRGFGRCPMCRGIITDIIRTYIP